MVDISSGIVRSVGKWAPRGLVHMVAGSAFKIKTWAELVTALGTGPIFAGEEGKLVFCV
jgi:hypothetical protein